MSTNRDQLISAISDGILRFGFQSFNLTYNKSNAHEFMTDPTLTDWSKSDLEGYHRNNLIDCDPLLELLAERHVRKLWRPADWHGKPKAQAYRAYVEQIGVRSGVTVTLAGRADRISAFTALSRENVEDPSVAPAIAVLAQAALAKAAALEIPGEDLPAACAPQSSLTAKQLEILSWAREGKSNRDIATILSISTRTVNYHMSEILKKLGVASRTQAITMTS